MRYLLDANIISEVLRRPDGAAARRYQTEAENCFTSIIVASEMRYGIAKHPERTASRDARVLLEELLIVPFEPPSDEEYGCLRAHLELAGTPIGANDMLIAAHALALDCILVSANEREFRRVPGLKIENWAA
ncbi:MAG TPA: type II toxin-antitoxin system VapC family toxin [Sphingomicrobium sp.]|nr:type II toxin-antitoxin system VapC family toxin [Sphingomicrobium sp.]